MSAPGEHEQDGEEFHNDPAIKYSTENAKYSQRKISRPVCCHTADATIPIIIKIEYFIHHFITSHPLRERLEGCDNHTYMFSRSAKYAIAHSIA